MRHHYEGARRLRDAGTDHPDASVGRYHARRQTLSWVLLKRFCCTYAYGMGAGGQSWILKSRFSH